MKNEWLGIGLMSGTSLDGLDIALCRFLKQSGKWNFSIIRAETIAYNSTWREKLEHSHENNTLGLLHLSNEFGKFSATSVNTFLRNQNTLPDFVASHGHTVFHQPQNGITFQLGSGAVIAAETGLTVICDFRSTDVALGGQGAPLVPIGDMLLFAEYDFCLNLGGFANISFQQNGNRKAFDICPLNIVANYYSRQLGKEFDVDGKLGRNGKIHNDLLLRLNEDTLYTVIEGNPISLSREWVWEYFIPILDSFPVSTEDKLRTLYEHAANRISRSINNPGKQGTVLVTGGGAYNLFFLERLRDYCKSTLHIPEEKIIQYKEALVFAFLGLLRINGEINTLRSVTGCTRDHSGGCIYRG